MQNNKIVLGIDPGFDRMGVALLAQVNDKCVLLHSECVVTKPKDPHSERLKKIGIRLKELVEEWQPKHLAIETLFFNQNASSAIGVAEARGVALYEAACGNLQVFEYSPQAVKIATTGYGKADKIQVEAMVRKLVNVPEKDAKKLDDELDAIAVGITHLATVRMI